MRIAPGWAAPKSHNEDHHSTLVRTIQAFRQAIGDELQARYPLSKVDSITFPIRNGRLQHRTGRTSYFLFDCQPFAQHLIDESNPVLVLDDQRHPCRIVGFSTEGLALALEAALTPEVPQAHLVFDSIRLLQALDKRLGQILRQPADFNTRLSLKAFQPNAVPTVLHPAPLARPPAALNNEQASAFVRALQDDLLFVLGPPGTGKSELISAIAQAFLQLGQRILICSPTNTAIDHILDLVLDKVPDCPPGTIARVGTASPDSSERSQTTNLEALVLNQTTAIEATVEPLRKQLSALEADLPGLDTLLQSAQQLTICRRATSELQQRHELLVQQHEQLLGTIAMVRTELEEAHHRLTSLRSLPWLLRLMQRRRIHQLEAFILQETPEQARRYATLRTVEQDLNQSRQLLNRGQEQERLASEQTSLSANTFTPDELQLLVRITHDKIRELQQAIADGERRITELERTIIKQSRFIATTLTRTYTSHLISTERFDAVIVDEASMGLPPAVFAALCLSTKTVIIVGDFLQLPPITSAKTEHTKAWLARDIYQIAQITSGQDQRVVSLATQYRMHPDIARVASRLYARAGLAYQSAAHMEAARRSLAAYAPAPGQSLIVLDTAGVDPVTTRDRRGSPYNLYHAMLAVRLAMQTVSTPGEAPSVSIIAPYRAQVHLIERLLRLQELADLVQAGTVHRFQGRQSDVVIFDTVTTANIARTMLGWGHEDAAPHKLINVAITRAKGKLILIGHAGALEELQRSPEPLLWDFLQLAREYGVIVPATSLLATVPDIQLDTTEQTDHLLREAFGRSQTGSQNLRLVEATSRALQVS
jgi:superfamily I DNA and/or RNA helicase